MDRMALPTVRERRRIAGRLRRVDKKLRKLHGTTSLGNKLDPLDELIFIQLTVRTRNGTSTHVYERLRTLVDGDWGRLPDLPESRIVEALRPAGMARIKARRFRGIIRQIVTAHGRATLDPLAQMDNRKAEEFLTALPGVGPKVARCVLMYSLNREVFPVDANCRRVLKRLGVVPGGLADKKSHDYIQPLVPTGIRHTLHVNLVHHGTAICLPRSPRCDVCPLVKSCPTARSEFG